MFCKKLVFAAFVATAINASFHSNMAYGTEQQCDTHDNYTFEILHRPDLKDQRNFIINVSSLFCGNAGEIDDVYEAIPNEPKESFLSKLADVINIAIDPEVSDMENGHNDKWFLKLIYSIKYLKDCNDFGKLNNDIKTKFIKSIFNPPIKCFHTYSESLQALCGIGDVNDVKDLTFEHFDIFINKLINTAEETEEAIFAINDRRLRELSIIVKRDLELQNK